MSGPARRLDELVGLFFIFEFTSRFSWLRIVLDSHHPSERYSNAFPLY